MNEQTHISIGDIFTALVIGLPVGFGIALIACKWSGLIACSWHSIGGYELGLLLIVLLWLAADIAFNGIVSLIEVIVKAFKGRW